MSIMMLQRIEEHLGRVQKVEEMGLADVSVDISGHKRTLLDAYRQRASTSKTVAREALEQELERSRASGSSSNSS